jgi:hypothetical protein
MKCGPGGCLTQFDDALVHVGAETPVKTDFFVTVEAAPVNGGEVEETVVYRFFYLVGVPVGQKNI